MKLPLILKKIRLQKGQEAKPKISNFPINYDILVISDSNGKYFDTNLLYPVNSSRGGRKFYCPCIKDVRNLLKSNDSSIASASKMFRIY